MCCFFVKGTARCKTPTIFGMVLSVLGEEWEKRNPSVVAVAVACLQLRRRKEAQLCGAERWRRACSDLSRGVHSPSHALSQAKRELAELGRVEGVSAKQQLKLVGVLETALRRSRGEFCEAVSLVVSTEHLLERAQQQLSAEICLRETAEVLTTLGLVGPVACRRNPRRA